MHYMKLLLTSDGLTTSAIHEAFLSLLPKPIQECSALLLANIQSEQAFAYSLAAKEEINNLGVTDAIIFNLNDETFTLSDHFDIIYVCGGNTFRILDRMKKTGVYAFVEKEMKTNNCVYIGVSAGSIIAGPNIAIAGHGSECDPNDIHLTNLESFGFTNISILPHFKPHLQSEADEFQSSVPYPVIAIQDREALLISENEQRTIK